MIDIRRSVILGLVLVFTKIAAAGAADIILPREGNYRDATGRVELVPSPMGIPQTASWYIRGDIAYAFHDDPDLTETSSGLDLTREEFDETWTIGGGFGHYITPNLRGDITIDYRDEARVTASDQSSGWFAPGVRSFEVTSLVVLANLYYDFHSFSGGGYKDGPVRRSRITPYLGVGLGFATHWMEDGTSESPCGCDGIIDDEDSTSVAAAFMAGFAWDLRYDLTLDAGYRFLYLGDIDTGDLHDDTTNVGPMELEDVFAHEFRLGLRYDIF